HHLADTDVARAREQAAQEDGIIDYAALSQIRLDLNELESSDDPHRRGKQFEEIMERLLLSHGCRVERGELGDSEQVDLFMVDPQYALIECRWKNEPLQPKAIYELLGKL